MIYFKWLLGYVKQFKKQFIIALSLAVIAGVLSPASAFITKRIINQALRYSDNKLLLTLLAILMGVTVFTMLISFIMQITLEKASQNMLYEIRTSLYNNMQKLDIPFFNQNSAGEIMSIFTGDVQMARHMVSWVFYQSVYCISIFITGFTILLIENWKLALLLLTIAPLIFVVNYKFSKIIGNLHRKSREHYSKLSKIVSENIDANRVVKAYTNEEFEFEKFQKENENFKNANINISLTNAKFNVIINILTNFLTMISLFVGSIFVIYDKMSLGSLALFTGLVFTLEYPTRTAIVLTNDMQRFFTAAKRIMLLMFASPDVKQPENPVSDIQFSNEISFNNVSLGIDDKNILSNISFSVKAGETVAIMGECGSGKTMLLNLLLRFLDPTDGSITIDGVDIRNIQLQTLRKQFSLASQDVFLFSDSISNNIAYSDINMSDEEIEHFANLASADGFIRKTSDGYETVVGERGVGLSGGQKQRIALARALASKSPVLVLDDTTSALDMETEKEIQQNLNKTKNLTTIIVSGRISSVKNADKIIILKDGKIDATGTHDELLKIDGYYKDVYSLQMD